MSVSIKLETLVVKRVEMCNATSVLTALLHAHSQPKGPKETVMHVLHRMLQDPASYDCCGRVRLRLEYAGQGVLDQMCESIKAVLRDAQFENVKAYMLPQDDSDPQGQVMRVECSVTRPLIASCFTPEDVTKMRELREIYPCFAPPKLFAIPNDMYSYFQRDNATPPVPVLEFIESFLSYPKLF